MPRPLNPPKLPSRPVHRDHRAPTSGYKKPAPTPLITTPPPLPLLPLHRTPCTTRKASTPLQLSLPWSSTAKYCRAMDDANTAVPSPPLSYLPPSLSWCGTAPRSPAPSFLCTGMHLGDRRRATVSKKTIKLAVNLLVALEPHLHCELASPSLLHHPAAPPSTPSLPPVRTPVVRAALSFPCRELHEDEASLFFIFF